MSQIFRLKICAKVDEESFLDILTKMGTLHYAMLYKNQSIFHRETPSPIFADILPEILKLSMISPDFLSELDLVSNKYTLSEGKICITITRGRGGGLGGDWSPPRPEI